MIEPPVPPDIFWGLTTIIVFLGLCWLIATGIPAIRASKTDPVKELAKRFGLPKVPPWVVLAVLGVAVALSLMWLALFLLLVLGLGETIARIVHWPAEPSEASANLFRLTILSVAGLTAALGGVVALPFTIVRLA